MNSVVDVLSRAEENAVWLSKNYEKMKKEYNNQWVAVLETKVVDHDSNFDRILKRVKQKFGTQFDEISLDYVTTEEMNFIL